MYLVIEFLFQQQLPTSVPENPACGKRRNAAGSQRPTIEFLVSCMNLVRELFDVDCFHGIPTKLNDVYYKLGQMNNFKKAIQNIFAPDKNYSLEKLIGAVQITHSQLNEQLSNNLKSALHSTNLHRQFSRSTCRITTAVLLLSRS